MSRHTTPRASAQQWLDNSAWAGGRVHSTAPKEVAVMWLFAVIWNALGLPVGWMVLKGNEDLGVFLAWVLPLFVFTGVSLLFVAVRDTMRWRRPPRRTGTIFQAMSFVWSVGVEASY